MRLPFSNRFWAVIVAMITIIAFYESSVGNDLSPATRVRIIFAALFLQTFGLTVLGLLVRGLISDLRNQHRAATQIAIIRGLWRALEVGSEGDRISLEIRQAIHQAGEEAFQTYDRMVRHEDDSRQGESLHPQILTRSSRPDLL